MALDDSVSEKIKAENEDEVQETSDHVLNGRRPSSKKLLPRLDSLHMEISFTVVLFHAVSLAYVGQAAYLIKFPEHVADTFYKSIPGPFFWPTFVVVVAAAIIASQAVISCVFSIIAQAQTLGCFPRVKVVHTSPKYEGQMYILKLNYALMIECILVTGSFKTTEKIGHAYESMLSVDSPNLQVDLLLEYSQIWSAS